MPAAVYKYIGEKINAYRIQRGLTQEVLADAIGVTANTISRWETAAYKVTVEDLEKLSRLFEIPIWSFLPSDIQAPTEQLQALLSATGDLPEEDLVELQRYATFIRARKAIRGEQKPSRRKRRTNLG